jgi:hypothetical protein
MYSPGVVFFASFVMFFLKVYFSIWTITVTCILPHLWGVSIAQIVQMTDYIRVSEEDPLVSHTHSELLFKFLNFKSLCLSTEISDWTSNWQCVNDGLIYQSIWDVCE